MGARTEAGKANCIVPPSFLYLRGRIFYFRLRLPKQIANAKTGSEIRVCLKTPYIAIAKKLVSRIYALTQEMLDRWKMEHDESNIAAQVERFRTFIRNEVNAVLSGSNKAPISPEILQQRLDLYLQQQLKEEHETVELQPVAEFIAPGQALQLVTIADACSEEADRIHAEMLSGAHYEENFTNSIMQLVQLGVLKPEEISEEMARSIVKAFMITRVKLNQILAARYKGDYTLEKILCPKPVQPVTSQMSSGQASWPQQKEILLSQLIEKYIQTSLNDGRLEKRTVADHRNRVETILVILGDKPVNGFSRADISHYRSSGALCRRYARNELLKKYC